MKLLGCIASTQSIS